MKNNNYQRPGNNDFTDEELDREVQKFTLDHPKLGMQYIMGHIKCNTNMVPTQKRLKESIERVDPEGLNSRRHVQEADFMIQRRGHNSFICGPSKFNERIERLWRKVRVVVIEFYQNLFN